jgi:acyl-CoA reductase-like NAD-dependent aldehyde dehydrogenase
MKIINPATEQIITEVTEDTTESLIRKFALLQAHQPVWQKVTLAERVDAITKFSLLLEKNIESLAAILTAEVESLYSNRVMK